MFFRTGQSLCQQPGPAPPRWDTRRCQQPHPPSPPDTRRAGNLATLLLSGHPHPRWDTRRCPQPPPPPLRWALAGASSLILLYGAGASSLVLHFRDGAHATSHDPLLVTSATTSPRNRVVAHAHRAGWPRAQVAEMPTSGRGGRAPVNGKRPVNGGHCHNAQEQTRQDQTAALGAQWSKPPQGSQTRAPGRGGVEVYNASSAPTMCAVLFARQLGKGLKISRFAREI